ncbi:MAG: DUF1295 domain-containing protein [Candidatus Marinimicrobia bacterium]|jgi:steroid 5-alpha reductase family enzyme|nr:DUF1295 domain-containing protein [Candidatus Neomarinimicrobiota bacterium]MDD5708979.1 DUF1295 domain-containing protein [Candidatus Neomarinimicrobiota bacterium]MDX9778440.1 DUF1295 domain-containing protein [bacterium]
MSAFQTTLLILAVSIIVSFFYGLFTRNYSTVDRLWSVLPPVYGLIWLYGHTDNTRLLIATILVAAWGIRLTYNFARRGGYGFSFKQGFTGEDYRWEIMRERIPSRFLFELFNLFFISIFQLLLIFVITLPLYLVRQNPAALNRIDILLFALHLLFLIGETISDNQQYRFQNEKRSPEYAGSYRHQLGFNTFGLWKYSRHPNYFFEIAQWLVVALYALNASASFHPALLGVAVLILLFIGSTNLTESITESRYLQYKEWKKYTFAWFPLPLKKLNADFLESTME